MGLGVQGFKGSMFKGSMFKSSMFKVQGSMFNLQGSTFKVQGSRVQVLRVQQVVIESAVKNLFCHKATKSPGITKLILQSNNYL